MRKPPRLHHYTFAEYLAIEEVARVKHEYLDGEIYAMAGGTPEHAALSAVVTTMLGEQLRGGPCRVYSSDLRVRILATGLATYPDVTVVCGPTERDPESATHVVTPGWWSRCRATARKNMTGERSSNTTGKLRR